MHGRWIVGIRATCLVGLALCAAPPAPRAHAEDPAPGAAPPASDPASIAASLASQRTPDAFARMTAGLMDDSPPGMRAAVAAALAQSPPVPPEVCAALAWAIQHGSDAELPTLLSAARWTADRAVVGAVVDLLRRDSPAIRLAAMSTLRDETGEAINTDDPAGWIDWWNRTRSVTDGAWWRAIATNRGIAARKSTARLTSVEQRLRRLYLEVQRCLTEDQRSAFVADLMASPDAQDQALGLEFAERTILNARPLGPAEIQGAATILRSPSVELRARAAALLDRSDAPGLSQEIRAALRTETVPEVAASLVRLVGRRGWCDAEQDVMRWVRRGSGPAYPAALDAAAAMLDAGCLTSEDNRKELAEHAVAMVLSPRPAEASPAVARICATFQITWALRQLIASPIEEVARIAAESLASDPASVDLIVSAARTRPALYAAATTALVRNRHTAGGMATLAALPADEATRLAAVVAMARAMGPDELVRALPSLPSPEVRAAAIEQALNDQPPQDPPSPAVTTLRIALVDALIELGRPEAALAALNADGLSSELTASRRCMVLVWLGRLDDALGINDATVNDWMAGFERSYRSPHALDTVRTMEATFAGDLTAAQRSRIQDLLAQRGSDANP